MNRDEMVNRISGKKKVWDMIIIGGGATGTGIALDAAARGYRVLLLEKRDWGNGTSSRSTKLVHGGVRYLQQGNISLVLEALKERGILRRNAPHLVHNLPFIVPNYDWWEGPFYGIGLKIYDMLAGKEGFGSSEILSKNETIKHLPTVETDGLNGGVIYYDGQFDDARLVVNIARTAFEQGAVLINYIQVTDILKTGDTVSGVVARDVETDKEYPLKAKVVINATGAWSDSIRHMDDPGCRDMIRPSQGVHIVLDRSFLPGDSAIMVPHTEDGRVLFAIPWYDKVIVGTTDTPVETVRSEPAYLPEEQEFLLSHAARYLEKDPGVEDVLSIFTGIRPLVSTSAAEKTSAISRDHVLTIARSGLVTIAGGKWTTYRKMAADTVDQAATVAGLEPQVCMTETLQIHGYHLHPDTLGPLKIYGSDAMAISELAQKQPELDAPLVPGSEIKAAEVVWCIRHEMVRTVADFLSRRRRLLILDAGMSMKIAEPVSVLLANELEKDESWRRDQVQQYINLAHGYLCS